MSFDTGKNYVYTHHGKTLRLWRFRRTPARDVDTEGRTSTSGWHTFIYPDESITNGLRIEYTAIDKPFVSEDPDTTSSLTEATSPTESSHVNLNRMLTLAVIDYVKAEMSERNGDVAASFPVNGVIKGWTEALQLMPVGSKWKLFIPSELAYGANPRQGGPIEPNMALVFEVELLSIDE